MFLRKWWKVIGQLAGGVVLLGSVVLLVGCGALMTAVSSRSPSAAPATDERASFALESLPAVAPSVGLSGADAAKAAPAPGVARAEGGGGAQITDRMVVHNATIALEVESVPDAMNAVRGLVDGAGGFVVGSSSRFQGEKEFASLTLRVPATAYNQVMTSLRRLAAKVTREDGTARDVMEEFTDLDAQLRNLEATEAQYLQLMKRANTIDEILKVQAQLTRVQGQIERIKGRMNLLQRTSDMATVVVHLAPVDGVNGGEPPEGWDPGRSVRDAWEQSLVIVQAVADAGIRVAVFSWWLVPLALLAWLAWTLARRPQRGGPGG